MTGVPYSLSAHARDISVEKTPRAVLAEAKFRTACTQTNRAFLTREYPGLPFELIRHGIEVSPLADLVAAIPIVERVSDRDA